MWKNPLSLQTTGNELIQQRKSVKGGCNTTFSGHYSNKFHNPVASEVGSSLSLL